MVVGVVCRCVVEQQNGDSPHARLCVRFFFCVGGVNEGVGPRSYKSNVLIPLFAWRRGDPTCQNSVAVASGVDEGFDAEDQEDEGECGE